MGENSHPDGDELYKFSMVADDLSAEKRTQISLHVMFCDDCFALSKMLETSDSAWEDSFVSGDAETDRSFADAAIARFLEISKPRH